MHLVVRWGRSAYETAEDLEQERAAVERLGFRYCLREDSSPPPEISDAAVLIVPSGSRVDRHVVDRFGGQLILATTSGTDHIDLDACVARQVRVARLAEARRDAVVEQALAHLITLLRRLPDIEAASREGRWVRGHLPELAPKGLRGTSVAVVGLGVIGSRLAEIALFLGAKVVGVDPVASPPGIRRVSLDEALSADALTLHCSLTPSSRNLLSAERIARLRNDAVIVNTARGDVLDVEAAVDAVRHGRLRGLGVDVFPIEPYPALAQGAAVPGVLFTPHSAGYTALLGAHVVEGITRVLTALRNGSEIPWKVV